MHGIINGVGGISLEARHEGEVVFRKINKNCTAYRETSGPAQSTVNALAIALNITWKEAVQRLAASSHALALMPSDVRCVKDMLRDSGFYQQPMQKGCITVEQLCSEMNHRCFDGEVAVIQCSRYIGSDDTAAVIPDENGRYICSGGRDIQKKSVLEIWVRWQDGEDHSPVPRRLYNRRVHAQNRRVHPEESSCYHYAMRNPKGNYTGDCVLRAMSSVTGLSWNETLDKLLEAGDYGYVTVNAEGYFDKVLRDMGYSEHMPIRKGGRLLSGEEFCAAMNERYHGGERILAYMGRSHVAAVVPVEENGAVAYKIEDTWDSSHEKVGRYFSF